jgi:hypothetical protein
MFTQEEQFKREIYEYCDNNVRKRILFTGFTFLWALSGKERITPKDLALLTSEIINSLVKEKILIEVPKKFESVYGMYKILPHEILMKE